MEINGKVYTLREGVTLEKVLELCLNEIQTCRIEQEQYELEGRYRASEDLDERIDGLYMVVDAISYVPV